jgi:hypothetical protein
MRSSNARFVRTVRCGVRGGQHELGCGYPQLAGGAAADVIPGLRPDRPGIDGDQRRASAVAFDHDCSDKQRIEDASKLS